MFLIWTGLGIPIKGVSPHMTVYEKLVVLITVMGLWVLKTSNRNQRMVQNHCDTNIIGLLKNGVHPNISIQVRRKVPSTGSWRSWGAPMSNTCKIGAIKWSIIKEYISDNRILIIGWHIFKKSDLIHHIDASRVVNPVSVGLFCPPICQSLGFTLTITPRQRSPGFHKKRHPASIGLSCIDLE